MKYAVEKNRLINRQTGASVEMRPGWLAEDLREAHRKLAALERR